MSARLIRLRYAATCTTCGAPLAAKASAWWDADAKTARCESCGDVTSTDTSDAFGDHATPVEEAAPTLEAPAAVTPEVAGARRIRVRYSGTCGGCGSALSKGTTALWDAHAKSMRCLACAGGHDGPLVEVAEPSAKRAGAAVTDAPEVVAQPAPPQVEPEEQVKAPPAPERPRSQAGASAQREFERRKAKREADISARHPRLGGLILALSEDPQSTTAWAKGAEGERRLGAGLDGLAAAGVVAIHDRRVPGTKANVDHLAVSPNGVWVIDAKRYKGEVAKRDVGGWFSTDLRLFVGRRDCTKLVSAMSWQVAAVRKALGADWAEVPVRPVLCFVDAEWGWFAKPFELDGVLVAWPKAVRERLVNPGPYTPEGLQLITAHLESRLRPA